MPPKGFKRNGVEFRLEDPDLYHYEAFTGGNVKPEELRKEYSRLRQVANKRLNRMKGTRYEKTQTYLKNAGKYGTIAEIEKEVLKHAKKLTPDKAERYVNAHIAKKVSDLYRMLTSKTGSIKGMREVEKRTIDTLNERGFTFINKNNIHQFGEYMEYLRLLHMDKQFDSERAAELFATAEKKGIDPNQLLADFEYWTQHTEDLANLPKIKNPKQRTAAQYKKLLEKK